MASKRSEDLYGQKVDRCLYNALVKFVSGVGIGIVFSALLFKRKPWPVILGAGLGTGMGISDCNNEFKGHAPLKPLVYEKAEIQLRHTSEGEECSGPRDLVLAKKPKFFHQPSTSDTEVEHRGKKFLYRESDDDDHQPKSFSRA